MKLIFKSLSKIFIATLLLVLALNLNHIGDTNSSFVDKEKSIGNSFIAGSFDIGVDDPVNFSADVTPTDNSEADFKIIKNTSSDMQYIISFDNVDGDLCGHLNLKSFQGNETLSSYDDALNKFEIMASEPDSLNWKFKTSLDSADLALQNKECKFDIKVKAWRKDTDAYTDGFSDSETAQAKIDSGKWSNGPDVVINEIMWMGSDGDTNDEWIELRNMTDKDIDLSNWQIENGGSGSGHIEIPNGYKIKANGYFLILNNKWNETAIKLDTDLDKDKGETHVASMNLLNSGEQLILKDKDKNVIDTAWKDSAWPEGHHGTGTDKTQGSMERKDPPDDGTQASSWKTCTDSVCNSGTYWDTANGNNYGTPGAENK